MRLALLTIAAANALLMCICSSAIAQVTDPCTGITCGGYGNCLVQNGSPVCVCYQGYTLDQTGINCVPAAPPQPIQPAPQPQQYQQPAQPAPQPQQYQEPVQPAQPAQPAPQPQQYQQPAQPTTPAPPPPAVDEASSYSVQTVDQPSGLMLTAGTMQLGGYLALVYGQISMEGMDRRNGASIEVLPTFGYFMIDNLELKLNLIIAKGFGQYFEDSPWDVGAMIGIKYHLQAGSAFFYIGADVGMEVFDYDEGDPYKYVVVAVPLGFLIPLNYHVAIDIGILPTMLFGLGGVRETVISIPVGYLGVQGYF